MTGLLEGYFSNLVDYEFTANLEDDLDAISRGEKDNLDKLKAFYFGGENLAKGLKDLVTEGEATIDPREVCGINLGVDPQGRKVEIRIGRWGPFLSNGETRASLPDGVAFDELTVEKAELLIAEAAKGPASLGADPTTNEPIYLKKGRFGPYVQRGDMVEGGEKPKMASLLPGMQPDSVTLEVALMLLSLPRTVGKNPENEAEITIQNGRFGPYIKCGTESRTIPADESPFSVTLERAIELLKQPRTRGRASNQPKTLKDLGKHPRSGESVTIKSGRYGPYVTDGTTNASLPQGAEPEALTMEQAVELMDARAAKGPSKGRRRAAKPKAAKAAAPKKAKAAPKKKASKKATPDAAA